MPLQASGQISLADIAGEFGGAEPHSISEYYRNGTYVTSNNTNVPEADAIDLADFYNAAKQSYTGFDATFLSQSGSGSYVILNPERIVDENATTWASYSNTVFSTLSSTATFSMPAIPSVSEVLSVDIWFVYRDLDGAAAAVSCGLSNATNGAARPMVNILFKDGGVTPYSGNHLASNITTAPTWSGVTTYDISAMIGTGATLTAWLEGGARFYCSCTATNGQSQPDVAQFNIAFTYVP